MKKAFLFLTTAALILSGCAKENFNKLTGRDGVVTFTVSVPDAGTRAVTHEDGAAAKINHWIMEVIDADGDIYNRQAKTGTVGALTQTFEVSLVKNQTYTVLFWADSVDTNFNGAYNTESLRDIKLVNVAGYVANEDSRDAFSAVVENFQSTSATSANNVTLKRPFAQMNVVFTDLAKLYSAMLEKDAEYAKYEPVNFKATAQIPTSFNVMTQEAGSPATVALVNTAATNYRNNYYDHSGSDILYMDYIFATKDTKDIVDIDFEFYSKGSKIAHAFTSIPFQRNYRTNIMGDFMTSNAQWTVTVDPTWITPEYEEEIRMASTLEEAQKAVQKTSDKPVVIQVGGEAIDNATTDDVVEVGGKKYLQFILKTTSPENVKFELPEISSEDATRLGADTWLITYEANYPTEVVAVEATDGAKLKIEAPTSHVEVVGTTFAEITAKTGDETLVIPAGVTVNKLIVLKGGLQIHGVVLAAEVNVTGSDKVYVRDCEGLSQSVYDVLKDYIDAPKYEAVQNGDKWDIVEQQPTSFVTMGAKSYFKIEDAFKEVESQEGDDVTIIVHRDLNENMAADYTFTKNVLITTDNANGVSVNLNCAQTNSLVSNGGKTLTVDTKVTITNLMQLFAGYGDADSKAIIKGQLNSMQIWAYNGGKFYIVPGAKVVCDYGDGMVKFRYDSEINVEDNVESAAAIDVTKDTPIFKCGYLAGDKDGAKVLNLKNSFTQTQFLSNSGKGSFTVNMDNAVLYTYDDGLYRGINFGADAAGNISMKNGSRIISDGPVVINSGTVFIEIGSTISAKSFTCAGTINIDATNASEDKILVISATDASTYSNVTVTGNYSKLVENNCLYIQGPLVKIGDTKYATLDKAIAAVKENETIELLGDCETGADYTMAAPLALTTDNVTLNLNGKKLTVTENLGFVIAANNVTVKNGTIEAGANSAKVTKINSYAVAFAHMTQNQKVTGIVMEDVNVHGGVYAGSAIGSTKYEGSAELTMKNSNVVSGDFYDVYASCSSVVNIESGIFTSIHENNLECIAAGGDATYSLTGGTFDAYSGLANYVASGYELKSNGGNPETWSVVAETYTEVGSEAALKTAISNASAGDKIKLTDNIVLSSALTIEKAVIINLGGNTITSGSSLDATDASKRPINIKTDGVVLKNGTINGKDVKPGYALINVHNNCTLENIVATTPGVPVNVRAMVTMTIKGANTKFTTDGIYATKTADRCYEACVFVSNKAVVNVEDGEFTGRSYAMAIATSGGTINISGGTFNKGIVQTEDVNGNLAYSLLDEARDSDKKGYINISGNPTIKGSVRGQTNNCPGQYGIINIQGGIFDSDCVLYSFDDTNITLSSAYSKTFKAACPYTGYGQEANRAKSWTLTKNN